MAQPKAQTLQARFGFQDTELTTPKHDEIMLWLDKWVDTNIHTITKWDMVIVKETRGGDWDLKKPSEIEIEIPEYPTVKLTKKIWECPITDKNYTIGFADMVIQYDESSLSFIRNENVFELGGGRRRLIYFEVKPQIPSLGELIRQIRMYQTYTTRYESGGFSSTGPDKWFVVSPDTRFREQLKSQGIGFVEVK